MHRSVIRVELGWTFLGIGLAGFSVLNLTVFFILPCVGFPFSLIRL